MILVLVNKIATALGTSDEEVKKQLVVKYGTLETDENVPHGTLPAYDGAEPEKPATAQFTYHFTGWDKDVAEATDDVTYTAMFDNITNSYTVKFVNEDGALLQFPERSGENVKSPPPIRSATSFP